MKLKKRRNHDVEVAAESLGDIMFFLMLFFLIVSTFANPNVVKLVLPKAGTVQDVAKKEVTLSVTKDKQYFIDRKPVPFEQLESELQKEKAKTDDVTVVLRTDYSLTVQDLVDVLQMGSKLKIKMMLATKKE